MKQFVSLTNQSSGWFDTLRLLTTADFRRWQEGQKMRRANFQLARFMMSFAIIVLPVFISGGAYAKEPDIVDEAVVELGYSQGVAIEVRKFIQSIVSAEKFAKNSEKRIRYLVTSIRKAIQPHKDTFDLIKVLSTGKADCIGYAQLFYLVARTEGLDHRVVLGTNHMANGVTINGQFYLVDAGHELFEPVNIERDWLKSGNYFVQRSPKLPYIYDNIRIGGIEILRASLLMSKAAAKGAAKPSKEEVLHLYQRAIAIDSQNVQIYSNLGIQYEESDHEKALGFYNKALNMCPENIPVYWNRADLLHKLGRTKDAIVDYSKAIEIASKKQSLPDLKIELEYSPQFVLAMSYYNRGVMHRKIKDFATAIRDVTAALKIFSKRTEKPNTMWGFFTLSSCYTRALCYSILGNKDLAQRDIDALKIMTNSNDMLQQSLLNTLRSEIESSK